MLGQYTREEKPACPESDGGPFVLVGKTGGLGDDALDHVIHERVHDVLHSLIAGASIGVDLLENLVDVDRVRFLHILAFLGSLSRGFVNSNRIVTHSIESSEYI